MELYNCYSFDEKILREIELTGLDSKRLVDLAQTIQQAFREQELENENIVIDALTQITEELGGRVK
ncbi:hypothetical protein [Anaerosalibacter massiliensis]|uniref:hypothetical protein n=1 Tax=Anaerosalibacter massiliensis TaxID=1347392 RepID=UPI0005B2C081|nr:hypothetical protein [Anaerosalibacter massiliensis]